MGRAWDHRGVTGPAEGDDLDGEIERAAAVLEAGGLVAFPTETVYGLGADAGNPEAVARVFAVKGRPSDHPLIVHIGDAAEVDQWAADVPMPARLLADAFWPGPLTLLLDRAPWVPDAVTGGRPTVGLRVPDHRVARALLRAFARPRPGRPAGIAAPSANRFGRVSPTTAAHVRADLGDDVDLVLDGGPCEVGLESTIVDCTGARPRVLRLGGVSLERLADVLGVVPEVATDVATDEAVASTATPPGGPEGSGTPAAAGGARAPGMLASHYAPRARVEVVDAPGVSARAATLVGEGHRVVVLAPSVLEGLPVEAIELEPAGPPDDFARVLYDRLRQADRLGADDLLVVPPPPGGLGDAVRDRLRRAAH
jgi:L-threonylcarbamoyladenylate synthase